VLTLENDDQADFCKKKPMVMHFTETAPQQSEHFEWINAFERFQFYIDAVQEKLKEVPAVHGNLSLPELSFIEDKILELRNEIYDLSYAVSEHIDETETIAASDNRLDLDFQVVQHHGLRDRFHALDEDFNALRLAFNTFYTKHLATIDGIPRIPA
jgi:hypothetical protein